MFLNVKALAEKTAAPLATDWKITDATLKNGGTAPIVTKSNGTTLEKQPVPPSNMTGWLSGTVPVMTTDKDRENIGIIGLMGKFPNSTNYPITWPDSPSYSTRKVFYRWDGLIEITTVTPYEITVCDTCYSTCYNTCWGGSKDQPERENYAVAIVDEGEACPSGSSVNLESRVCLPLSFFPWMYCRVTCYGYYDCGAYNCEPSYTCNCRLVGANQTTTETKTKFTKFFWRMDTWWQYAGNVQYPGIITP
jgi:hypothetical protein